MRWLRQVTTGFGLAGGLLMLRKMQPVNAHLALPQEHSPWMHLYHTVREPRHCGGSEVTAPWLDSLRRFRGPPQFGSLTLFQELSSQLDRILTLPMYL